MAMVPLDWLGDSRMWNTWIGGFVLGIVTFLMVLNIWRYRGHRQGTPDGYRGASPTTADNPRAVPVASPREGATEGSGAGEGARQDLTRQDRNALATQHDSPQIPDYIEAIIGLRAWELSGLTTLQSVTRPDTWPAFQRLEAYCGCNACPQRHVPGEDCKCGIYAVRTARGMQYQGHGPFVWGGVALWGKVIEAERGYRAQYAYPVGLVLVNFPNVGRHVPVSVRNAMMRSRTSDGDLPGMLPAVALEHVRQMLADRYQVPVRIGTFEEYTRVMADNVGVNRLFEGVPAEVTPVLV